MLISVILPLGAFFDGYPSQFVLGTYVGSMVTLCGLNFYVYYCAPAAYPAAAARVEQEGEEFHPILLKQGREPGRGRGRGTMATGPGVVESLFA